jgi:hypothetical protein
MNIEKMEKKYWRVNLIGGGARRVKKEYTGQRSQEGAETLH